MFWRVGGRIVTAVSACTWRPSAPKSIVGVVAADDAVLAQRADALRGRRGRDVDRGGEVAVARPCIVLQDPHKRPVRRIKSGHHRDLPHDVRSSR